MSETPILCGTPKAGHVVVRQLRDGRWGVVAPSGVHIGTCRAMESAVRMAEVCAEVRGLKLFIETLIDLGPVKKATIDDDLIDED